MKPHPVPQAMTGEDIKTTIAEFVQAAENAVAAGFDGIELHSANGYLLEQFIRPNTNLRTDVYGGPIENRARFVLETVEATINAIGKEKVGIRLSPFGVFNDMPLYDGMASDYTYLAEQLNTLEPVYIHLVDHSGMGMPPVPDTIKATFRREFKGTLILSGGYDAERSEKDLAAGKCDLIAVGRPFLANPDLVDRWKTGADVNDSGHGYLLYTWSQRLYRLPGSLKNRHRYCINSMANHIHGIIAVVGVPPWGHPKNRKRFAKTGRHKACPNTMMREKHDQSHFMGFRGGHHHQPL